MIALRHVHRCDVDELLDKLECHDSPGQVNKPSPRRYKRFTVTRRWRAVTQPVGCPRSSTRFLSIMDIARRSGLTNIKVPPWPLPRKAGTPLALQNCTGKRSSRRGVVTAGGRGPRAAWLPGPEPVPRKFEDAAGFLGDFSPADSASHETFSAYDPARADRFWNNAVCAAQPSINRDHSSGV